MKNQNHNQQFSETGAACSLSPVNHPDANPSANPFWDISGNGFDYPDEIRSLVNNEEVRELLDEFVQRQMFVNLAQTLNRILIRIIESENSKAEAVVIAWAIGIRADGTETSEAVLAKLSTIGISRKRAWLFIQREDILKAIKS